MPGRTKTPPSDIPGATLGRTIWHTNYKDGLEFLDFLRISQEPCHYCGSPPSNLAKQKKRTFRYNGLDRKDSSLPHTLDNVVPCCKTCNFAKQGVGYEEFLVWIAKVYAHRVVDRG
jgi:hypothetical protein